MRDPRYIIPDIKLHLEKRAQEIINKEFPEIKEFSVKCDIETKTMSFQGLTTQQEVRVLDILFQKN